ncbi:hypothetical protein [Rhizobium jaguaris]|uniref:hypothetical protein n=1 Tax=Rhizobium jaguaris TaxID=1312183 RepID=UPI00315D167F
MADRQMMEGRAISSRGDVDAVACIADAPSMARGACPSLSAPMMTGDGLLVRLRPTTPGLTIGQFRALAQAADRHGNALIEITARGNLQLRGLTAESMIGLAADIDRAAIIPETGVTIEIPPLSGLDPLEIADARELATRLRQQIAALDPQPVLAPKLTIIIDSGGRLNLDAISADIRLRAARTADGSTIWVLAIGGTKQTAKILASLSAEQAVSAIIGLLKTLAHLGPRARGRDLDVDGLRKGIRRRKSAHSVQPACMFPRSAFTILAAIALPSACAHPSGKFMQATYSAFSPSPKRPEQPKSAPRRTMPSWCWALMPRQPETFSWPRPTAVFERTRTIR